MQGYVLTTDTAGPSGLTGDAFMSWLADFHAEYPSGQPLPLYSSNGTTILGTFPFYR
ncbi:hypothetical protein [Cryobacterium algoritolerans]|uniref:hypothetical protein n=1 Tax=Cryobacterium algoritolerans TaxID=1259184 RepID=UPI00141B3115|nr:hypothetical protein [Cryobacterium algoritolerans]